MLSYKVIGRHLKDARERLGKSQQDIADAAGISVAYYGKIERGDIRPNLDRLAQACEVLEIPILEVFHGAQAEANKLTNTTPTETAFLRFFEDIAARTDKDRRELIMQVSKDIADHPHKL